MATERSRVFTAINEKAVDGDPVMQYLAEEIPRPDLLLNNGEEAPEDRVGGERCRNSAAYGRIRR